MSSILKSCMGGGVSGVLCVAGNFMKLILGYIFGGQISVEATEQKRTKEQKNNNI